MTRINCIPVQELTDKHLVAEYREMLRLPNNVRRWLKAKNPSDIPKSYRMGKGHVAFFYNKLRYLERRHKELRKEMRRRGFVTNYKLSVEDLPERFMNDWEPTLEAQEINRTRIKERLK